VGLDDGRGGTNCVDLGTLRQQMPVRNTTMNLWWASNPGAMAIFLACWIQHSSLSRPAEVLMLSIAKGVFENLDAERGKQTFASEVVRLESESRVKFVQEVDPLKN